MRTLSKIIRLLPLLLLPCTGLSAQSIPSAQGAFDAMGSERSIVADPYGPDERMNTLLQRGVDLYRRGWYRMALLDFYRAAFEWPDSLSAHFNLAATHYRLGDYREAEREIAQCLRLDPGHPGSRYLKGLLYRAKGAEDQARLAFRELADSGSANPFVRQAQGRLWAGAPDPVRAEFYGLVRSIAGFSQDWRADVPASDVVNAQHQELFIQTGWGPFAGTANGNLACSAGLFRDRQEGAARHDAWSRVGVSGNPRLSERTSVSAGYDLTQVLQTGRLGYLCHQAGLAAQFRRWGLELLQFGGQVLLERYPSYSGMNARGTAFTGYGDRAIGEGWSVQSAYTYRRNLARERIYDYRSHVVHVSVQRNPWNAWGLSCAFQWQHVAYPSYPAAEGGSKTDRTQEVCVEFSYPLMERLSLIAGDGFRFQQSNIGTYAKRSNTLHTGLQWLL